MHFTFLMKIIIVRLVLFNYEITKKVKGQGNFPISTFYIKYWEIALCVIVCIFKHCSLKTGNFKDDK